MFGVRVSGEVKWTSKVMGGTPTWDILTNIEVVCAPHLLYDVLLGVHMQGVDSELYYLSWSDGVSCKIWSQMCGSWYLPKFLMSEGSLFHMYTTSFIYYILNKDGATEMGVSGLLGCKLDLESDSRLPPTWDIFTNIPPCISHLGGAPHLVSC